MVPSSSSEAELLPEKLGDEDDVGVAVEVATSETDPEALDETLLRFTDFVIEVDACWLAVFDDVASIDEESVTDCLRVGDRKRVLVFVRPNEFVVVFDTSSEKLLELDTPSIELESLRLGEEDSDFCAVEDAVSDCDGVCVWDADLTKESLNDAV